MNIDNRSDWYHQFKCHLSSGTHHNEVKHFQTYCASRCCPSLVSAAEGDDNDDNDNDNNYNENNAHCVCVYACLHLLCVCVCCRSCASAVRPMGTAPAAKSACCVWETCGRSAATVWVSAASPSLATHDQGCGVYAQQSGGWFRRHFTCYVSLLVFHQKKCDQKISICRCFHCMVWNDSLKIPSYETPLWGG